MTAGQMKPLQAVGHLRGRTLGWAPIPWGCLQGIFEGPSVAVAVPSIAVSSVEEVLLEAALAAPWPEAGQQPFGASAYVELHFVALSAGFPSFAPAAAEIAAAEIDLGLVSDSSVYTFFLGNKKRILVTSLVLRSFLFQSDLMTES